MPQCQALFIPTLESCSAKKKYPVQSIVGVATEHSRSSHWVLGQFSIRYLDLVSRTQWISKLLNFNILLFIWNILDIKYQAVCTGVSSLETLPATALARVTFLSLRYRKSFFFFSSLNRSTFFPHLRHVIKLLIIINLSGGKKKTNRFVESVELYIIIHTSGRIFK